MTRAQRGKEITNQGQMLGNKAWGKPLRVQLASRTSQHANKHYRAPDKAPLMELCHKGTHGRWETAMLKMKPLPSGAFLEADSTRPEAVAT